MMQTDLERSTLRRVAWRLVPFICLLYLLNIIDRVNLGFARRLYDYCRAPISAAEARRRSIWDSAFSMSATFCSKSPAIC